jgi:hypothetical protein
MWPGLPSPFGTEVLRPYSGALPAGHCPAGMDIQYTIGPNARHPRTSPIRPRLHEYALEEANPAWPCMADFRHPRKALISLGFPALAIRNYSNHALGCMVSDCNEPVIIAGIPPPMLNGDSMNFC